MNTDGTTLNDRTARLAEQFGEALDALERAKPFAKPNHQNRVIELALRLIKEPDGPEALHRHAPRFQKAGVFRGSDWDRPATLEPGMVSQSLHAKGSTLAVEALSELRLLAIALGEAEDPTVSAEQARQFLEDVLGGNIDLLFPETSEQTREADSAQMAGLQRLFGYIADKLGPEGILESIVDEAERILRQRPILVGRVRRIVDTAARTMEHRPPQDPDLQQRATLLIHADRGPTELARQHEADPHGYAAALSELSPDRLAEEAKAMGDSMWATGLVCAQHAPLLRRLAETQPDALPNALGLGQIGRVVLDRHRELVRQMIDAAIHPPTAQSVYGLASLLECGVLFFPPVPPGLHRLMKLPIGAGPAQALQQLYGHAPELSANAILLAGAMSVLGQPLGVGQGDNPTCQSARAISLWAQGDVGYLLELTAQAARDDRVVMHFEGQPIDSGLLQAGMTESLHTELDAVSRVLVPHLDRVYVEMGRRISGRGEDGHKWVNPELHGWWVWRGFASTIDYMSGAVVGFERFIRLFYATYHPEYRGPAELIHAQPAGVASTNLWGQFLGWHAISIHRVWWDPEGVVRVYFYNPNNDKGQRWGQGIVTSTSGHGELAGESSLPFEQFAARLYLFHYNEREHGAPDAVPAEPIQRITELVRTGWAAQKQWLP